MEEAKKKTLQLSKYFVSLPHPAKTLIAIFASAFLFGVLFSFAKDGSLTPMHAIAGGADGIYLLAFPAVLSALVLFLLRKKAIFRRASFLSLITSLCYGVFYLLSLVLSKAHPSASNLIFVGFGTAFALWYFLLLLAFDFKKSALLFAAMQSAFFAFFLISGPGLGNAFSPENVFLRVMLASAVFIAGFYLVFYIVSAPMKKNLGVSSLEALSLFASQWLYGDKGLEEVFEEIGENVRTFVWVASFQGKKNNALFVVPYIHFGPFGNLGGSEFTSLLSRGLSEGGRREVFVFHGTATHDFNPVSSSEAEKVIGACKRALSRIRHKARLPFSFSFHTEGSTRASAMAIGDFAMLSYTRAPKTTEDIDFGLGLALMERASLYCKKACVVDEHNCETGDISSVEPGSAISFEMLEATSAVLSKKPKTHPFLFGCSGAAAKTGTIGGNGLKLALFAYGEKKMRAVLLVDSNSITPKCRERIIARLSGLMEKAGYRASHAEVMSTDTHQINNVRGVLNPLGEEDFAAIDPILARLFEDALSRLESVKFGAEREMFEIRVFGTGQSAEIASTINAVVAVIKLAFPMMLIGLIILLVWGLSKL